MDLKSKKVTLILICLLVIELVVMFNYRYNNNYDDVKVVAEDFCIALYEEDSINDYPGYERIQSKVEGFLGEGLIEEIESGRDEEAGYFLWSKDLMADTSINIKSIVVEPFKDVYKVTVAFEYIIETEDKETINYRFTYLTLDKDLKVTQVIENL